VAEEGDELRRQLPHPLIVAGLAGDVGEEMTEAASDEAQEAPLLGAVEQNLGDGEAEHLGVLYPRLGTRPGRISLGQESSAST
jgi:hypothetical protein